MAQRERAVLLLFILLLVLPGLISLFTTPAYWLRVLTSVLMLASVTLAQNILLGYTGYPAFGAVAFFGIGGYTTAVLMVKLSLPFWVSLPAGGALAFLCALLIAPPLMRLKSHYFAIATLAFQLALMELVANLEFTGGSYGVNLPIYRGPLEGYLFYYLFWLLAFFTFLLNVYTDRSFFGYALKAIREDEVAAQSVGVNTLLFKTLSFSIMSGITGLAGGIYAYWITYIDPTSVFDPVLSVKIFVALLLGGVGTMVGPVVGAFFLELVSELVWSRFLELHGVILGLLILLTVLLVPKGFLGVKR